MSPCFKYRRRTRGHRHLSISSSMEHDSYDIFGRPPPTSLDLIRSSSNFGLIHGSSALRACPLMVAGGRNAAIEMSASVKRGQRQLRPGGGRNDPLAAVRRLSRRTRFGLPHSSKFSTLVLCTAVARCPPPLELGPRTHVSTQRTRGTVRTSALKVETRVFPDPRLGHASGTLELSDASLRERGGAREASFACGRRRPGNE
jgi:hypothetical protein